MFFNHKTLKIAHYSSDFVQSKQRDLNPTWAPNDQVIFTQPLRQKDVAIYKDAQYAGKGSGFQVFTGNTQPRRIDLKIDA